jgi:hypothetical protein
MRAIESLVKQGFISTIKALGKRTKYTLLMDSNPRQIVTPDKLSPLTQCHPTPDTHDRGPLTPMSPEPVSNSNKPVIKSVNKFTDTDYSFSEWFYEKVLMVAPHTKKPNLKSWSNQVRLMREVDKISYQDMSDVFVWANQHDFWNTNILSIGTFRAKFSKLHADSKKKPKTNQYGNQQNQQPARATQSLADAFK